MSTQLVAAVGIDRSGYRRFAFYRSFDPYMGHYVVGVRLGRFYFYVGVERG